MYFNCGFVIGCHSTKTTRVQCVLDDVAGKTCEAIPWAPLARSQRRRCSARTSCSPGRKVIENRHSKRDRSKTYFQGECSYRRVDSLLRNTTSVECVVSLICPCRVHEVHYERVVEDAARVRDALPHRRRRRHRPSRRALRSAAAGCLRLGDEHHARGQLVILAQHQSPSLVPILPQPDCVLTFTWCTLSKEEDAANVYDEARRQGTVGRTLPSSSRVIVACALSWSLISTSLRSTLPSCRGLHSSTSQLNLSRVSHKNTPYAP